MNAPNRPVGGVRINVGFIPPEEWANPCQQIMRGERELPDETDIRIQIKPDGFNQPMNLLRDACVTKRVAVP